MIRETSTDTAVGHSQSFDTLGEMPVLLVAHAPKGAVTADRVAVVKTFVVGRSSSCAFPVGDEKISKTHFQIKDTRGELVIKDLGSSNGTFVDGRRLVGPFTLHGGEVIRAGRAVFVFHRHGKQFLQTLKGASHGFAGSFHSPVILRELLDASRSARHVLLTGSTGTGKELAVAALASLYGEEEDRVFKMVSHNAARFASAEEASTTLFGVAAGVFSGVKERPGLIEVAADGILFLDEIHNLPKRVQRSLLRVMEDKQTARIGEATTAAADVRFVLATNADDPARGLAHDLFARLRMVHLPSLAERVADIPQIYDYLLEKAVVATGAPAAAIHDATRADHYESLCLDGFEETNVRALVDIVDRVVSRIKAGDAPDRAVTHVFSAIYAEGSVAQRLEAAEGGATANHYERNKEAIIAAYRESGENLTATERLLKSQGHRCSRRWLSTYLVKWGIRW